MAGQDFSLAIRIGMRGMEFFGICGVCFFPFPSSLNSQKEHLDSFNFRYLSYLGCIFLIDSTWI